MEGSNDGRDPPRCLNPDSEDTGGLLVRWSGVVGQPLAGETAKLAALTKLRTTRVPRSAERAILLRPPPPHLLRPPPQSSSPPPLRCDVAPEFGADAASH